MKINKLGIETSQIQIKIEYLKVSLCTHNHNKLKSATSHLLNVKVKEKSWRKMCNKQGQVPIEGQKTQNAWLKIVFGRH